MQEISFGCVICEQRACKIRQKKNLESISQKVVSKFLQSLKFLGPRRDVCFARGRFASAAPPLIVSCSLSQKTRQHVALATLSTMNGSHPKKDLVQKPAHANDSALFLMINAESRVEKYALHHHQQFWQFYVCLSVRSMFRTSPRIRLEVVILPLNYCFIRVSGIKGSAAAGSVFCAVWIDSNLNSGYERGHGSLKERVHKAHNAKQNRKGILFMVHLERCLVLTPVSALTVTPSNQIIRLSACYEMTGWPHVGLGANQSPARWSRHGALCLCRSSAYSITTWNQSRRWF